MSEAAEVDRWKLDAGLSAALDSSGLQEVEVIVRTKHSPNPSEVFQLQGLGVRDVSSNRRVFTARLAFTAIAELSNQCWVQSLKLSRELRSLGIGRV